MLSPACSGAPPCHGLETLNYKVIFRRCEPSDLIGVMEINMKTLPEHYSDYFYESLLAEAPEAFLVDE